MRIDSALIKRIEIKAKEQAPPPPAAQPAKAPEPAKGPEAPPARTASGVEGRRSDQAFAARHLAVVLDRRLDAQAAAPAPAPTPEEKAKAAHERAASDTSKRAAEEATQATDEMLESQRAANAKAREAGQQEPYPAANGIKDSRDLARLPEEEQEKILGTKPGVRLTRAIQVEEERFQAKADADAARIDDLSKRDPAAAAAELERTMGGSDEQVYKDRLAERSRPAVERVSEWVNQRGGDDRQKQEAVDALTRTAEKAGPNGARQLAEAFASKVPSDGYGNRGTARVYAAMKGGNGALFGVELASALHAEKKEAAAHQLDRNIAVELDRVRSNYESEAKDADKVDADIARFIDENKGLSDAQIDAGVKAIRDRNKEAYEKRERAAEAYAKVLPGAGVATQSGAPFVRAKADALLQDLPALGRTEAGRKAIGDALFDAGRGQPTFLDAVPGAIDRIPDEKKRNETRELTSSVVFTANMQRMGELMERHDLAGADTLLYGTQRHAGLVGLKEDEVRVLQGLMRDTKSSEYKPEDFGKKVYSTVAAYQAEQQAKTGAPPNKRFSAMGFGITAATGGVALTRFARNGDKAAQDYLSAAASALGIGAEVGTLLGDSSRVGKVLGVGGKIGTALGIVGSAIDAYSYLQQGKTTQAAVTGLTIIGSAAAAGAVGGGPVGALVGTAVGLAGAVVNFGFDRIDEANARDKTEDNARAFLEAAGVPAPKRDVMAALSAQKLSAWPTIDETAKRMGLTRDQLLDRIAALPEEARHKVLDEVREMARNEKGWPDYNDRPPRWKAPPKGRSYDLDIDSPSELQQYIEWATP